MAFTQDRILSSIEYNLIAKTINVAWKDRVLNNGVVVFEENHRGAYPVDENGEVDPAVQTLLGQTLQDILGDAASQALANSISLQNTIDQLVSDHETAINNLNSQINNLNQQIINFTNQVQTLTDLNEELLTENQSLKDQIEILQNAE